MQTTSHPYELLIRWDRDGALAGAHVQWRHVMRDDSGNAVGVTLSSPVPRAKGIADGFRADALLTPVVIDELIS